jgi:hypothetical protein
LTTTSDDSVGLIRRAEQGEEAAVAALAEIARFSMDDRLLRRFVASIDSGVAGLPGWLALSALEGSDDGPGCFARDVAARWLAAPPAALGMSAWELAEALRSRGMGPGLLAELVGPDFVWVIPEAARGQYSSVALPLAPNNSESRPVATHSVSVEPNAVCRWCSSPLWLALDLDTADPVDSRTAAAVTEAIAHTGWRGRLQLATCAVCVCDVAMIVFTEVRPDGTGQWSPHNTTKLLLWEPQTRHQTPPRTLSADASHGFCATPFQADAWHRRGSALGGAPNWIQSDDTPECPGCGEPMPYLGMISAVDADPRCEGGFYFFLHATCGIAATIHQQS